MKHNYKHASVSPVTYNAYLKGGHKSYNSDLFKHDFIDSLLSCRFLILALLPGPGPEICFGR